MKLRSAEIGLDTVKKARQVAVCQHISQLIASVALFVGGAWALTNVILFLNSGSFIQQVTDQLLDLDISDVADTLSVITLLSPPVLLALVGFVLIGLAIRINRHPVIQRSLSGVSRIQHELAAGIGETRPLVQVVQETISNARETFTVQLRLSQALFWVGMLFLVITLWRVVGKGQTDVLEVGVTVGTGTMGILGWIFSYLISQNKKIQANLADVTQLELGLVGIAKQVGYLDLWLGNVLLEPYLLDQESLAASRKLTAWGLQEVQRSTFAAAGLVELYAQAPEEKEGQEERRKLLNQAVRIHTGLIGDRPEVMELAAIAGDYAVVLAESAGLRTVKDLRKAGASPTDRKQLSDKTGIRAEVIMEFVRLADLVRLQSVTSDMARLLRDAGIASVADLGKADPPALHQTLADISAKQKRLPAPPLSEEVANWIEQAKVLPQEITY